MNPYLKEHVQHHLSIFKEFIRPLMLEWGFSFAADVAPTTIELPDLREIVWHGANRVEHIAMKSASIRHLSRRKECHLFFAVSSSGTLLHITPEKVRLKPIICHRKK